uniref:ATP synthase complex subunit 8 n=1 Tax=Geocharax gracilis TaxID=119071 RepID=W8ZSY0_9EUCA|nr:ATP synthase F0 subunit 8 [Geocharax gracilis]CDN85547.1 ATP synthase F0 subunit 8 [Geocharax gracilis]
MPQMSPLLWLNLFFFFLMGALLFLIINYFSVQVEKKEKLASNLETNQKPWSW